MLKFGIFVETEKTFTYDISEELRKLDKSLRYEYMIAYEAESSDSKTYSSLSVWNRNMGLLKTISEWGKTKDIANTLANKTGLCWDWELGIKIPFGTRYFTLKRFLFCPDVWSIPDWDWVSSYISKGENKTSKISLLKYDYFNTAKREEVVVWEKQWL